MKKFSGILNGVVITERPKYNEMIIDDIDYIKEIIIDGDGTYSIEGIQLNGIFIPMDENTVLEIIENM